MNQSDWNMQELAKHERDLDAQFDFDAAVDRKAEEIAHEFVRECSYGSPEECALLDEAFAGLPGNAGAIMLGNLIAGGHLLKTFLIGFVTAHTQGKAEEEVSKLTNQK